MIIAPSAPGPRDAAEFTVLGDAGLIDRPDWQAEDAEERSGSTIICICGTTRPASTGSCGSTNRATGPGWSSPATH